MKKAAAKKITAKKPSPAIVAPRILSKGEWAVPFDTETTGLVRSRAMKLEKQPEVIEFYANYVDLKTGKIGKALHYVVRPVVEFPMSEYTMKATRTKLSNELLADSPTYREVSGAIQAFMEEAPHIIAHNLSFDKEMIEIEMERLEQTIKWPMRGSCTVEQSIHLRGHRLNMQKLYGFLFPGEEFEGAHRAEHDVKALTRVAVEMHKRGLI